MSNGLQRGSMSMLTVIVLALLLTIITTGFIQVTVQEARQSTDNSLTNRAFYAAESGIEDAKRALKEYQSNPSSVVLNEDICDPPEIGGAFVAAPVELSADLATYYTCLLIDDAPEVIQADIRANESITIPLNAGGASLSGATLSLGWHIAPGVGNTNEPDGNYGLPAANGEFYSYPAWVNSFDYPAALAIEVFSLPSTGSFNRSDFQSSRGIARPSNGGTNSVNLTTLHERVIDTNCDGVAAVADGDYICNIDISGFADRRYYLHIKALYKDTSINLEAINSVGSSLPIEGAQAVIDSTGRAGQVFRRLQARVALSPQYPLPDFAIWSNEEICKDFYITDDNTAPQVYPSTNTCAWSP